MSFDPDTKPSSRVVTLISILSLGLDGELGTELCGDTVLVFLALSGL